MKQIYLSFMMIFLVLYLLFISGCASEQEVVGKAFKRLNAGSRVYLSSCIDDLCSDFSRSSSQYRHCVTDCSNMIRDGSYPPKPDFPDDLIDESLAGAQDAAFDNSSIPVGDDGGDVDSQNISASDIEDVREDSESGSLPSELNEENVYIWYAPHFAAGFFPDVRSVRVQMFHSSLNAPFDASNVTVELYNSTNGLICTAVTDINLFTAYFAAWGELIDGYRSEDFVADSPGSLDPSCNLEIEQLSFNETYQVRIDDPRFKPIIKTFRTGTPSEQATIIELNVEFRDPVDSP